MKPFLAEVTTFEASGPIMFSANERKVVPAIERDLPGNIHWLPQTVKFKIPLSEDDNFIYHPNLVFRRVDTGKTLVAVVMEPLSLPLPNIYKMKLLENACRSVNMEGILILNLVDGDDEPLRKTLIECEVNHVSITRASDFVDIVARHLGDGSTEQTASLAMQKKGDWIAPQS